MNKEVTLDTSINPKYCCRELGEILYRDKLISISKYEKIATIMKKYARNKIFNNDILKDLQKEVQDKNILEIIPIENLGYTEDFLNKLNSLEIDNDEDSEYRVWNGITDTGYLEFSNKYSISKDLQTTYGLSIITKDIINKIIIRGKVPIRILSYIEAEYINFLKIEKDEKILLIGADLGYLYIKHNLNHLYIYENDEALKNFLKEKIYDKINLNVTFLTKEDIHNNYFDKIIINPSFENDLQLKLFYNLELYKYQNIYTPKLDLILSKFKLDLQDLIMTDKEQVIDSLLEGLKEMKGIGQIILESQLDFVEKADKYLEENNIYFDNYKKYQKFINNDKIIYEILKQ